MGGLWIQQSAVNIRQDDVQDYTGEHQHHQVRNKAHLQKLVPSLSALGPGIGLETKQSAQQSQQGKILVVVRQQRNDTNGGTNNHKQVAENQPEPVLKPSTRMVSELAVELVKTIVHERYPLKVKPIGSFCYSKYTTKGQGSSTNTFSQSVEFDRRSL